MRGPLPTCWNCGGTRNSCQCATCPKCLEPFWQTGGAEECDECSGANDPNEPEEETV